MQCDTLWKRLPLTPKEENDKRFAIGKYGSQVETMGRFLSSFVRGNEIFGDIPAQSAFMDSEKSGAYDLEANGKPWPQSHPVSIDPTGDNILLALQKGADIASLWAYHDSQYVYIRMNTNGTLVPDATYTLHIRAIDLKGVSPDQETVITVTPSGYGRPGVNTSNDGIEASWRDSTIEAKIPLLVIHAPADGLMFIEGVSRFSKLLFDRTGPRAIRIRLDTPLLASKSEAPTHHHN